MHLSDVICWSCLALYIHWSSWVYIIFVGHISFCYVTKTIKQHTVNHKSSSIVYQWSNRTEPPNLSQPQQPPEAWRVDDCLRGVAGFQLITWNRWFLKPPALKRYGIESTLKFTENHHHICCFGWTFQTLVKPPTRVHFSHDFGPVNCSARFGCT